MKNKLNTSSNSVDLSTIKTPVKDLDTLSQEFLKLTTSVNKLFWFMFSEEYDYKLAELWVNIAELSKFYGFSPSKIMEINEEALPSEETFLDIETFHKVEQEIFLSLENIKKEKFISNPTEQWNVVTTLFWDLKDIVKLNKRN